MNIWKILVSGNLESETQNPRLDFHVSKPNSFMLWDVKSCLKGQVETVNLHLSGTFSG